MRLSKWLGKDYFLYARHDFHTVKEFILIAGSGKTAETARLCRQFSAGASPGLLSVVGALLATQALKIATVFLYLDSATQRLEAGTGFPNRLFAHEALPPEQLSSRKDLVATRKNLHGAYRTSKVMQDFFTFMHAGLSGDGTYYTAWAPLLDLTKAILSVSVTITAQDKRRHDA